MDLAFASGLTGILAVLGWDQEESLAVCNLGSPPLAVCMDGLGSFAVDAGRRAGRQAGSRRRAGRQQAGSRQAVIAAFW